jgi:hypothetical protein
VPLRCATGRASRAVGNDTTVANRAEPRRGGHDTACVPLGASRPCGRESLTQLRNGPPPRPSPHKLRGGRENSCWQIVLVSANSPSPMQFNGGRGRGMGASSGGAHPLHRCTVPATNPPPAVWGRVGESCEPGWGRGGVPAPLHGGGGAARAGLDVRAGGARRGGGEGRGGCGARCGVRAHSRAKSSRASFRRGKRPRGRRSCTSRRTVRRVWTTSRTGCVNGVSGWVECLPRIESHRSGWLTRVHAPIRCGRCRRSGGWRGRGRGPRG